ncbi:PH domain-containing protein [Rathayibacter sp. VKM Ac-2759]|uniref:PH domain-containing protein n=1 Tax=Rathayibacter sp. VKM Ac-2759 TaxID=2609252 RepID=UPI001316898C|nr:PH domain-containing protein [Rathayibacter sp. VKM Ac-2759]QHC67259.1 PH domain-containing protein [Rathayibacter sp. VKM Ac-2759]
MSRQERDLARLTPRARTAAGPIAGFLLLTWTGFYFAAQFELDVQRWIIGLGTGVLVLLLCVPGFARWAGIRYRITEHGLHARRGLLRVRRAEVVFDPRMTVSVTRSLPQRIARCADVTLEQGGAEVFVLRDLPDPELAADLLRETIAAAPAPEWPEPLGHE